MTNTIADIPNDICPFTYEKCPLCIDMSYGEKKRYLAPIHNMETKDYCLICRLEAINKNIAINNECIYSITKVIKE